MGIPDYDYYNFRIFISPSKEEQQRYIRERYPIRPLITVLKLIGVTEFYTKDVYADRKVVCIDKDAKIMELFVSDIYDIYNFMKDNNLKGKSLSDLVVLRELVKEKEE